MRTAIIFVVAVLLFTASPARADEPKLPEHVLVKPTFLLANESWSGGTAFLLQTADRRETLLVTCHHLFGPATGRDKQMSGDDIKTDVRVAVGLSMQDTKTLVVADSYISFADARAMDRKGAEKDLAAFVVKADKPPTALQFAEEPPRVGQDVYMFARLRSEAQPRLFPATVVEVGRNWLLYAFKDKALELAGTSGAPILNDSGKVVGMNLGGNEQNGKLIGIANPATRMKENLAPAPK